MKITLLNDFNRLHPNFAEERSTDSKYDLGIACDILLDLIRFDSGAKLLINATSAINHFKLAINDQDYSESTFLNSVDNNEVKSIL
jgi:hypothetical protein